MRRTALLLSCIGGAALAQAQGPGSNGAPDTTRRITFGGFVDMYYAFDFNRPATFDRSFTTQPARHNEFNVNLAFVEAKLDAPTVRGRIALQAGTSVQANYAGEPRNGNVSGADLARFIQEAVIGVKLGRTVWVDGGVFFSHLGMESFVSRDNAAYTRSMVGDFSPYYQSGAKLTWQPARTLTAQVDVINGWQIISESNSSKSGGVRIDYAMSPCTTISYFNYLGNDAPDSAQHGQMRFYHGAGAKSNLARRLQLLVEIDYGTQRHASGSGSSEWSGGMLTGRYDATSTATLVGRVERYVDRDQVIVSTGRPDGLRTNGASLGMDVTMQSGVLWRTELRGYRAQRAVFPMRTGVSPTDAFIVTSLALTF